MQFITFAPKETAKINDFLMEHANNIVQNGIFVFPDRVSFLYFTKSQEEIDRDKIAKNIRDGIVELRITLAQKTGDVMSAREKNAKTGTKESGDRVVDSENARAYIEEAIKSSETVLKMVLNGEI